MNFDQIIQGYKFRNLVSNKIGYFDTDKIDDSVYDYDIVVTHNSDYSTSMANLDINRNKNMVWFSTNVDIIHPRIRPIPIGLENPEWHTNLQKNAKIEALSGNKYHQYLCMAIFNPATHPSRVAALNYFKSQPWCKTRESINGTGFDEFLLTMYHSKFVVCPRGNGIDTHRLWETLYMGKIPVLERCHNVEILIRGYFPAVIVDSFEEVTEELLENFPKYSLIKPETSKLMLNMRYWEDLIRNKAGY
jgi:hypothetical protein